MTTRPRLSLRAWLLLSYLLVFSLPWVAIVGSGALDHDLRMQTREHLTAQGHLWALRVGAALDDPQATLPSIAERLKDDLRASRALTLCGVQVVDTTGVVLASDLGRERQQPRG